MSIVTNAYNFISGMAMMGAFVSGLLFLRFWRRTGDRFFLIFGLAFWVLAIERIGLIFVNPMAEDHEPVIYLMRMFAFLLILSAVWDKNRPGRSR